MLTICLIAAFVPATTLAVLALWVYWTEPEPLTPADDFLDRRDEWGAL